MKTILGIKVYTVKETADILELSAGTISNYIKAGKLPARKIGGAYHITEENIKDYLRGTDYREPQPDRLPGSAPKV